MTRKGDANKGWERRVGKRARKKARKEDSVPAGGIHKFAGRRQTQIRRPAEDEKLPAGGTHSLGTRSAGAHRGQAFDQYLTIKYSLYLTSI